MEFHVTPALRLQSASNLLACLLVILVGGYALFRVIGRGSPERKLHGRFVFGWMIAGWIVGSCIGVAMLDYNAHIAEADVGFAGAGLLVGWFIGTLHGVIVLWRRTRRAASFSAR